jgi:hypothetical protein
MPNAGNILEHKSSWLGFQHQSSELINQIATWILAGLRWRGRPDCLDALGPLSTIASLVPFLRPICCLGEWLTWSATNDDKWVTRCNPGEGPEGSTSKVRYVALEYLTMKLRILAEGVASDWINLDSRPDFTPSPGRPYAEPTCTRKQISRRNILSLQHIVLHPQSDAGFCNHANDLSRRLAKRTKFYICSC